MSKQRMVRMLTNAQTAIKEVGLGPQHTEIIGHLILASAIEESGSSISMSLDKLERLAVELGDVAQSIKMVAANLPNTE